MIHLFRLALADRDGLDRTADYLADVGINCREFTFSQGVGHTASDHCDPY